ncbi:aminopeptidase P family N-terminal domain-containing protein [Pleomorphomonas carboxyditropha]|uniref:Creatinase N-terminal domain-containing protein n=1 Tax=Pleomorphomonas carboxyditropha TaxID=2023338 RepID=A0A2G9WP42_9HYPH|nr:aminopeptidase P family N-terminal domain-containing protein [Pleomorphomonas carboxyditropha]PIO96434.1 hypothetical protein CJ014_25330 [Pleomorphomonas carboxyditropha]
MTSVNYKQVGLPDFGTPTVCPELSGGIYRARFDRLLAAKKAAGLDTLVVYADREHCANLHYLTGFDPRFEEALMVVADRRVPLILTGPENLGRAAAAAIEVEARVYPPFGLLGQDRTRTPPLADLLADAGVAAGARVGLIGWKYFTGQESRTPELWSELPAYIVETIRAVAGDGGRVVNANTLMMANETGLRAINEIDQLAQFEFAASQASEAIKRMLFGIRPGMSEYEAVGLMQLVGIPLSCHVMLSTGARAVGLSSPSGKAIEIGDAFTSAVGLWGALTSRAGWFVAGEEQLPEAARDYLDRLAKPYFACAAEWYATIGIGVTGGEMDALARRHLGDPFFNLILNPGHLIHLDEWMNTPVYPGSGERFQSGQAVQCDIIPAVGDPYFTTNIEDGIILLDERGRAAFREAHPEAWGRIEARRAFMDDALGIKLKPEVLPLSNMPAYLPPFILAPERALTLR